MRFKDLGIPAFLIINAAGVAAAMTPPVVDFETIPADGTVFEGEQITDQYWSTAGIRFVSPSGSRLVLAKVGAPQKAFTGFEGQPDTPQPGAGIGQYFLTDDQGGMGMAPGPFEVEYRWPVQVASGVFLDVGEREAWKAEAFDADGVSRGELTIWPTRLAGAAIGWSLDIGEPAITRVRISFTGTASPDGVTFAFDNFRGSRPACAADLNGDGLADFGDYLEFLDAFSRADGVADVNGDGVVDFSDYLEFLTAYDTGC